VSDELFEKIAQQLVDRIYVMFIDDQQLVDGKTTEQQKIAVALKLMRPLREHGHDTPVGESRWLVEGTAHYPTRRCYWTGSFWAHDFYPTEPPAIKAARYYSKNAADAVIKTIPLLSTDAVHFIEAVEHMFNCGMSPPLSKGGEG